MEQRAPYPVGTVSALGDAIACEAAVYAAVETAYSGSAHIVVDGSTFSFVVTPHPYAAGAQGADLTIHDCLGFTGFFPATVAPYSKDFEARYAVHTLCQRFLVKGGRVVDAMPGQS